MEWPTADILSGGGVVGFVLVVFWLIATGRLVTKREHDTALKRIEAAESARDKALAQNAELMEMTRLGAATFTALRRAAGEGDQ